MYNDLGVEPSLEPEDPRYEYESTAAIDYLLEDLELLQRSIANSEKLLVEIQESANNLGFGRDIDSRMIEIKYSIENTALLAHLLLEEVGNVG